jgi:1-acyl-sn-glycerol-3-phosphate acyltransferase
MEDAAHMSASPRHPLPFPRAQFLSRTFLLAVWIVLSTAIGMVWALFRWKSPYYNKEMGKLVGGFAMKILGIELVTEGLESIEKNSPCVYILNHQSMLDGLSFASIFPSHTVIIAKTGVGWIPFFGLLYRAGGNILINRRDRSHSLKGLNKAAGRMRTRGYSILIFPEGTRNTSAYGSLLPFKKGAFHLARTANVPLVPILCEPHRHVIDFEKGLLFGGKLTLRVLPPIHPQAPEFIGKSLEPLIQHSRTTMLNELLKISSAKSQ